MSRPPGETTACPGARAGAMTGRASNRPEGPETPMRDPREPGPTGTIGSPRVWETMKEGGRFRAGADFTGASMPDANLAGATLLGARPPSGANGSGR